MTFVIEHTYGYGEKDQLNLYPGEILDQFYIRCSFYKNVLIMLDIRLLEAGIESEISDLDPKV